MSFIALVQIYLLWVVIFVSCLIKKSNHHLKYCLYGEKQTNKCVFRVQHV